MYSRNWQNSQMSTLVTQNFTFCEGGKKKMFKKKKKDLPLLQYHN